MEQSAQRRADSSLGGGAIRSPTSTHNLAPEGHYPVLFVGWGSPDSSLLSRTPQLNFAQCSHLRTHTSRQDSSVGRFFIPQFFTFLVCARSRLPQYLFFFYPRIIPFFRYKHSQLNFWY